MSHHESLSIKERVVRATAIGALGVMALAGCTSNAGAEQGPSSSPSVSASEAPTPTKTAEAPSSTPSASEVDNQPSGIIVDVSSFDDWDNKPVSLTPVAAYDTPNSKEWTCEQVFTANGLPGRKEVIPQGGWNGRQISDWFGPRLDLAWKLNLDKSNPKYAEVADKLLQCLTSQHLGTESNGSGISQTYDAYSILSESMRNARNDPSYPQENPLGDLSTIVQQTQGGAWTNGSYNESSVQYLVEGSFKSKVNLAIKYEFGKSSDYRAVGYYYDTDYTQFNK